MTFTLPQFLDKEVSHQDYYIQFATPAIIGIVAGEFSPEELNASNEPNFNDISLNRWEETALKTRNFISYDLIKETQEFTFSLILGVGVCKAIATELKNRSI